MDLALKTTENLHPILKYLLEKFSSEINLDYLLNPEGKRIALNLITEKTGKKTVKGYRSLSTRAKDPLTKRIVPRFAEVPIYEDELSFKVAFGYIENKAVKISQDILLLNLNDVREEDKGLGEIERISLDLKKVYSLPYNPPVYKNGLPVYQAG